ncbi:MAG: hypothetical protein HKN42_15345 [Granulosicoccus sp.]|nr:hypothetical protein [Granulosicoccus sp.]
MSAGSDVFYNPLNAFFSYTLDPLQVPTDFGIDNFDDNLHDVWYQLRHPRKAIEAEGGVTQFINREILPIDPDNIQDSVAALPNYSLHLLGGGLAFRKDLEWFRAHDYPMPKLVAVAWSMAAELIQEAVERKTTIDTDPIADFYLFRPLGIILFSQDRFARFIHRTLNPAIWPMMHGWDVRDDRFLNTGISYVYRPPALTVANRQGFIYTGLTTLFGLSHPTAAGGSLSWGIGAAVEQIVRQRDIKVELKPSLGLFHDRNNSLLWSVLLNDAGNNRLRVNVYPRSGNRFSRAGWFFSVDDRGKVAAGVSLNFPLGLGVSR